MYVRGYLQGSENGRVVTIVGKVRIHAALNIYASRYISIYIVVKGPGGSTS